MRFGNDAGAHQKRERLAAEADAEHRLQRRGDDRAGRRARRQRPSAPASQAMRAAVVKVAPIPLGESLRRAGDGARRPAGGARRSVGDELAEWAERRSGEDAGDEAVGERDQQPAVTGGELDRRRGRRRRPATTRAADFVDRIREREEAGQPRGPGYRLNPTRQVGFRRAARAPVESPCRRFVDRSSERAVSAASSFARFVGTALSQGCMRSAVRRCVEESRGDQECSRSANRRRSR